MQWVGRALSSVSQYYKEINPATLSGAIDVIVIQHADPKDGSTTLACSPFHVRYGKLSVLRPVDRTVYVQINGSDAPYHMKVGDTGEAFFVFETDQDVPADLQTSPLAGPVEDEEGNEPEPLDIGDSLSSLPPKAINGDAATPSEAKASDAPIGQEQEEVESKHESVMSRTLEGAVRKVQTLGGGAISLATAGGDKLLDSEGLHLPEALQRKVKGKGSNDSLSDPILAVMARKNAPTEEAFVASEFEGGTRIRTSAPTTPLPFGADPQATEEESSDTAVPAQDSGAPPLQSDYFGTAVSAEEGEALGMAHTERTASSGSATQDLMLDMAGYKMDDGTDGDGLKTPPAGEFLHTSDALDSQARDDILHEADPDVLALTRALLRYSEAKNAQPSAPQSVSTQTKEVVPEAARHHPCIFSMVSEGQVYNFEIALCQSLDRHSRTQGAVPEAAEFEEARISHEQLLKKPEVLQDPHLFIRFRSRYFGWENGSPALATLELYRKALVDNQAKSAPSKGTWKRWWGRGNARSRTTTEESGTSLIADSVKTEMEAAEKKDKSAAGQLGLAVPRAPASPTLSQAETAVDERESALPAPVKIEGPVHSHNKVQVQPDTPSGPKHYAKTLRLTSDQLKALNLKKGANNVSFTVQSSFSGVAVITSRIFLWESDYQVVISDIDGTITKSDALGHVFNMIGRDWTHPGVAKLYTDIASNGYKMLYLTSRAVGQADVTREYLKGISQNGFTLPDGPVIMSPDRLLTSLHREVVLRKPEVFKMACLRDIKRLFVDRNPFYAGFGNRLTDGLSYRSVEIPSSKIFTIDPYGNVKLELLELAGYTSSYIAMTNLVNETFPPVKGSSVPAYNDFNYWRAALPEIDLPDLMPVSPALSARSDSRMSVFRVASLAGAISKRTSKSQLRPPASPPAGGGEEHAKYPFSASPRSSSPSPLNVVYSSDEEVEETDGDSFRRQRKQNGKPKQRTDSMPGSYEDRAYFKQMRDSMELERGEQDEAGRDQPLDGALEDDDGRSGSSEDEDGGQDDTIEDDLPEMDFGSVPYL